MARNDDPNEYSDQDPTQYANYTGEGGTGGQAYSEYEQPAYPTNYNDQPDYGQPPAPEPTPWHRKPAALVGLGAAAILVLALVVFGIMQLTGDSSSTTDTTTTTSDPPGSESPALESVVPGPGSTETVTETPSGTETTAPSSTTTTTTPSTTPPTTTTTTTTTTTPPTTTTTTTVPPSTVTQTETETVTQSQPPPIQPEPEEGGAG